MAGIMLTNCFTQRNWLDTQRRDRYLEGMSIRSGGIGYVVDANNDLFCIGDGDNDAELTRNRSQTPLPVFGK